MKVKFNSELNCFDGLPKEWRQLLDMEPQHNELPLQEQEMQITDFHKVQKMRYYLQARNNLNDGSYVLTVRVPKRGKQEEGEELKHYTIVLDPTEEMGYRGLPEELIEEMKKSHLDID